tara:strand:- start:773 stop:1063 length:291 start_codon:yes stop_codon:yes gene_type:complete
MLRKILSKVFNYDPRYSTRTTRRLARGVQRDDPPRYIQEQFASEWAEVPVTELDDASYVQRLEEEERIRRARTTRLSEQHERMGRKHKEIPDPWFN